MRAGIWVGAVSIAVGTLFAVAVNGLSVVALLVVAGVVTLGLLAGYAASRRVPAPRAPVIVEPEHPQRPARPYAPQDRETAVAVLDIVDAPTINWLATEQFTTTWRDDKVARLRALLRFDDPDDAPIRDPTIRGGVERLLSEAEGFVRTHERDSMPDGLMAGNAWRVPRDQELRPHDAGTPAGADTGAAIRDAAARVVSAYWSLQEIVQRGTMTG
jgi:hypothetical protein